MALSKRLRFEVMRRDSHTCRYCGRSAPDVKLTVDHVTPEALGGGSEPGNLVTACADCNSGKSATPPDAPLVDDVRQDALRWSQAIAVAAERMLTDRDRRTESYDDFESSWNEWAYGPEGDKKNAPMPATWRESIDSFMAAGLPMPVLQDCIRKAMSNKKIKIVDVFRYMCGIAWSRVNEIQDAARAMVGREPDAGPDDLPLIVQLTEEQSGCSNCNGAGDLPVTILDKLSPYEKETAIGQAMARPRDERDYECEAASAACIAVDQVIDDRRRLNHVGRLVVEAIPEEIGRPIFHQAYGEVCAAYGDDRTDYDMLVNYLRHISEWIGANIVSAKVGA